MKESIIQILPLSIAFISLALALYSRFSYQKKINDMKSNYEDLLLLLTQRNQKLNLSVDTLSTGVMDKEINQTIEEIIQIWSEYKKIENGSDVYSEIFLPYAENGEVYYTSFVNYPKEKSSNNSIFYKEALRYLLTSGKHFSIVDEIENNDLKFKALDNSIIKKTIPYESLIVLPMVDILSDDEHKSTLAIFVSASNEKKVFKRRDIEIIHSFTHNIAKYLSKITINYNELKNE